jgi:phosphate transport system substrate-binding protein
MNTTSKWLGFLTVAATLAAGSGWAAADEPAGAKPYEKVSGVSGNINSVGSDTLNNMMTYWSESYQKLYPTVSFQVQGKGSNTAPPALTEGTSQLGPMSRVMKDQELEAFEKKWGFKPTRVSVALDCLAVFVHKDNPVQGLSLDQLDSIFSQTRKSGFAEITTWGQVGGKDEWQSRPVTLYGRDSASGTYLYFKEHVMKKGDFKDTVKEQPGSAGVVNAVANDKGGIGYSGIGYKTADVRAVPLAKTGSDTPVEPTFANALAGKYPLGRTLYIYVAKKPGEPLPPHLKEFFKFVLSSEGQAIVVKDGFGALPPKVLESQLKLVEAP